MINKDIISLNYQFLLLARDLAASSIGSVTTGLTKEIITMLSEMSLDEIEELANSGLCLFNLRFNEEQMKNFKDMPSKYRTSYAITVASDQ